MVRHSRADNGKIRDVTCFTRDGHVLTDCTLEVFQRLQKRRFVHSRNGSPYQISKLGIVSVRAQLDNR